MNTLPNLPADVRRRGVCQSGARGLTGYSYRLPAGTEMRAVHDTDAGTITLTHYAAVWNRYSLNLGGYVEQIAPGAFDESLRDDDQIASYNHMYETILGRRTADTLALTPDNIGLRYDVVMMAGDPDAQRLAAKVQHRSVTGSSFTFRSATDGEHWGWTDEGFPLVTVTRARLYEVAPVVWPAYPATADQEIELRSLADQTGRDLRDLVAAARENRLADLLSDHEPPAEQRSGPSIESLRRRVELRAREVAAVPG